MDLERDLFYQGGSGRDCGEVLKFVNHEGHEGTRSKSLDMLADEDHTRWIT
jgi:hypothetical protein